MQYLNAVFDCFIWLQQHNIILFYHSQGDNTEEMREAQRQEQHENAYNFKWTSSSSSDKTDSSSSELTQSQIIEVPTQQTTEGEDSVVEGGKNEE